MSAWTSPVRTRPAAAPAAERPARTRLTVVPPLAHAGRRLPFAALVVGVLTLGLVGLLLLNTSMDRGAFKVTAMQTREQALSLEQQQLQVEVANLQQPQSLANRALHLGMVADPGTAFLSLGTGAVRGYSAPGARGGAPVISIGADPQPHLLGKPRTWFAGQDEGGAIVHVVPPAQPPGTKTGSSGGNQPGGTGGAGGTGGSGTTGGPPANGH